MNRQGRASFGRVKGRSLVIATVLTVGALGASSTAYAGGSAEHIYGGRGGNVQAQVQGGAKDPNSAQGVSAASAETPAGLPFTGLDLTLMLGGGLVLVASGVALGRLAIRGARV